MMPDKIWVETKQGKDNPLPRSEYGRCCGCFVDNITVRNFVMMQFETPLQGTGWGCFKCDLPMNGAVSVLCDECIDMGQEPLFICLGHPENDMREPIAALDTDPHKHDMSRHPEVEVLH